VFNIFKGYGCDDIPNDILYQILDRFKVSLAYVNKKEVLD